MSKNQNQQSSAKVNVKPEGEDQSQQTEKKPVDRVAENSGVQSFEERHHPNDASVEELQKKKYDALQRVFEARTREGFKSEDELRRMEEAARRVEVQTLDLAEFAELQGRVAEAQQTLGVVQMAECLCALLLASNLKGAQYAAQKIATGIEQLKTQNGIPADVDPLVAPVLQFKTKTDSQKQ